MPPRKRYRSRSCDVVLRAWLPVAKAINGALLLGHLAQQHMDQFRSYLKRMESECIDTVVVELFEVVEGKDNGI